jgi:capsular exopolysaccharide synthesis family protein
LYKRRFLLLAVMLGILTITVVFTAKQQKLYRASASIIIDPKPPEILGNDIQEVVQLGAGQMWWNEEYYNTQVNILESRNLAKMTVKNNKLYESPQFFSAADLKLPEAERTERATTMLLSWLSVKPEADQNRIFHIQISHTDPKLAAHLANSHVDTYIQYNLNLRVEGTNLASRWLSGEVDQAETDLRNSELELFEFRKSNNILSVSLEDKQTLTSANIKRFTDALNDARLKRMEIEALRARLAAAKEMPVLESPVFALTESETGLNLKASFYEEQKKLLSLSAEVGEKNPEFIDQKRKVDQIRQWLEKEAELAGRGIEERYRAALATEKLFEGELERHKQEAFELGRKAIDQSPLARKEHSNEERFKLVLDRLRSSDLSSRLKTVNIRQLDTARVPTEPYSPRWRVNLALAMLLALVVGVAMAAVLEYLDRTVKTAEDTEGSLGAPLLGIIPIVPNAKNVDPKTRDLHVHLEPTSRAAECCRSIRTNLLFMSADESLRCLVVASPNPREGKSMSVMYLGTTMAQSGQRVLIIDSDLRRPRLHHAFGLSRNIGLSNLILGDVTPEQVIKATEIPNLFVLPAGPTPPNPAELLMTDRFKTVMETLTNMFDRVLCDSPPILAVTDALVLAQQADGVILVAKAGSTKRDDVARCRRHLAGVDARVVGGVLNQLDLTSRSYGYYHHYYAYGREEEAEVRKSA